ncbi:MAG TPA: bifunctional hydroxymethylpyrimidine kinase/phosphomethylpyrimidine kinase [Acidobacteriaceae bacterium]
MKTVLTIAGFDPSSGAGVTADLMVFAAHGLFGTSCITGLTVQSTVGVESSHPVAAEIVANTLECLDTDLPPVGVKIGMLSNASNTRVICEYLENIRVRDSKTEAPEPTLTVLDPVRRSSSGRELLDADGVDMVRGRLLGLVDWVTPNLVELAALSGVPVDMKNDVPVACRALHELVGTRKDGSRLGVFATGGHLDPPDDFVLTGDGEEFWLPGEWVKTRATHGTGCALSSAFLSRLVLGDKPRDAAIAAKAYVTGALREAVEIGAGRGPMNHLWVIRKVID